MWLGNDPLYPKNNTMRFRSHVSFFGVSDTSYCNNVYPDITTMYNTFVPCPSISARCRRASRSLPMPFYPLDIQDVLWSRNFEVDFEMQTPINLDAVPIPDWILKWWHQTRCLMRLSVTQADSQILPGGRDVICFCGVFGSISGPFSQHRIAHIMD